MTALPHLSPLFLELAAGEPDRFVVLNAAAPIGEIAAKIRNAISQRFAIRG